MVFRGAGGEDGGSPWECRLTPPFLVRLKDQDDPPFVVAGVFLRGGRRVYFPLWREVAGRLVRVAGSSVALPTLASAEPLLPSEADRLQAELVVC